MQLFYQGRVAISGDKLNHFENHIEIALKALHTLKDKYLVALKYLQGISFKSTEYFNGS